MTIYDIALGLAVYAGILAVLLVAYWAYGLVADRMHARRIVRAFDEYVKNLESLRSR